MRSGLNVFVHVLLAIYHFITETIFKNIFDKYGFPVSYNFVEKKNPLVFDFDPLHRGKYYLNNKFPFSRVVIFQNSLLRTQW